MTLHTYKWGYFWCYMLTRLNQRNWEFSNSSLEANLRMHYQKWVKSHEKTKSSVQAKNCLQSKSLLRIPQKWACVAEIIILCNIQLTSSPTARCFQFQGLNPIQSTGSKETFLNVHSNLILKISLSQPQYSKSAPTPTRPGWISMNRQDSPIGMTLSR